MTNHMLITIDVEDWFQVENFKQAIPVSSWPSCELRVEQNTHHLLNIFDSIKLENEEFVNTKNNINLEACTLHAENPTSPKNTTNATNESKITATFFILGWIAKRLPHLVREIHRRGHEVASHGYYHIFNYYFSHDHLLGDLTKSKKLLEDIIGSRVYGYRAPNFAVNNDILKVIADCGYLYDSSYNSFSMHKRYGELNLSENDRNGIAVKIFDNFYELPISNLKLGSMVLPWGGGGYFRLMPFSVFKQGVRSILREQMAFLFYAHPWEVDPEQPKVSDVSFFFRFRHYYNLKKTHIKLFNLLKRFKDLTFSNCYDYLQMQEMNVGSKK